MSAEDKEYAKKVLHALSKKHKEGKDLTKLYAIVKDNYSLFVNSKEFYSLPKELMVKIIANVQIKRKYISPTFTQVTENYKNDAGEILKPLIPKCVPESEKDLEMILRTFNSIYLFEYIEAVINKYKKKSTKMRKAYQESENSYNELADKYNNIIRKNKGINKHNKELIQQLDDKEKQIQALKLENQNKEKLESDLNQYKSEQEKKIMELKRKIVELETSLTEAEEENEALNEENEGLQEKLESEGKNHVSQKTLFQFVQGFVSIRQTLSRLHITLDTIKTDITNYHGNCVSSLSNNKVLMQKAIELMLNKEKANA